MPASMLNDLAEHSGTLVALLGGFSTLCIALIVVIYKMNVNLIAEIRAGLNIHLIDSKECQESLAVRFASKPEVDAAISTLFKRQNILREETLPGGYLRKSDMEAWVILNEKTFSLFTSRLDTFSIRIDKLIDAFADDRKSK